MPKEIKTLEARVGLTPPSVRELVVHGRTVLVETRAGAGIDIADADDEAAGARIAGTNAARMAMGLEAHVMVIDNALDRLYALDLEFGRQFNPIYRRAMPSRRTCAAPISSWGPC